MQPNAKLSACLFPNKYFRRDIIWSTRLRLSRTLRREPPPGKITDAHDCSDINLDCCLELGLRAGHQHLTCYLPEMSAVTSLSPEKPDRSAVPETWREILSGWLVLGVKRSLDSQLLICPEAGQWVGSQGDSWSSKAWQRLLSLVRGEHPNFGSRSDNCSENWAFPWLRFATDVRWTGSPNKSIDQMAKNCPKNVRKLCLKPLWTIFGHFFDISRTFCRHSHFLGCPTICPLQA